MKQRDGKQELILRGLDAGDGQTMWTRPNVPISGTAERNTLLASQGLLVGETIWSHTLGRWPLSYFVTFLDQWDGSYRVLPLPYSEFASTLVGASSGLLFVHHGLPDGGWVVAYRPEAAASPEPYELGGTSPGAWPDACELLPASDLAMLDDGYLAFPRERSLGSFTFPRPVSCDLVPSDDGGQAVTVTIDWVARSEAEATALLESEVFDLFQSRPRRPFEPGIHQIPGPGLDPTLDSALIQVGPVIAHLTVYNSPKNLRRVAPVVARNLRRHLGE
ncbi:hypothetical protein E1295_41795 [Nonomuraea mesophila]|uniref:Uncharacterized protein n=1 Tax=Nonomuraea mesophila TaxID=2530382 RepID=A0A4R5EAG6_9ACTN|nr:hypothetical protein [Nonomuraea mesophila]TDE29501.1 hypothetical protein E1295_41795 [Nonomuraea mesophila]